jgi:molybdopterin synthase catalytic subunit
MTLSSTDLSICAHVTNDAIDAEVLWEAIRRPSSGAVVTFEGRVRSPNAGDDVESLFYEAYERVVTQQLRDVAQLAAATFDLEGVAVVHRLGVVPVGETALFVAVVSPHRGEAFQAVPKIVDTVKAEVAIWKEERFADGRTSWL